MTWPRLNPLSWTRPGAPAVKRDLTYDQLAQLGLVPARAGGEGGPVSAAEAMGISAVFCADRVISEDLASSPMCVYSGHRLEEGAKPLYDDPITQLLQRPNPEMTGPVFWSQFQHHANIWGSRRPRSPGTGPGGRASCGRSNRRRGGSTGTPTGGSRLRRPSTPRRCRAGAT